MHRSSFGISVLKRFLKENQLPRVIPNTVNGIETIRSYSGNAGEREGSVTAKFAAFKEVINHRRCEARRSVLVQVYSEQSCGNLFNYMSKLCEIKNMFHYQSLTNSHFVLVELKDEDSVKSVLNHTIHFQPHEVVPVQSPFLWFRASNSASEENDILSRDIISYHNSITVDEKEKLENYLLNAESVSQQIILLYQKTMISELGIRLRFLTSRQLEMGLSGLFPDISVIPFGSSVNGFGKNNCDLDLVLKYSNETNNDKSRLIYHAKSSLTNERIQNQHHIEIIGDIIQLFMPGCTNIKKILQAKVPIIKYKQDLTGLDCDLCMLNMSGVQMSELLYTFSLIDERVKYLVCTVRYWAKEIGLTNISPGRWISNFSLTLLVLFYLQLETVSILPTLGNLNNKLTTINNESHEELLHNFFEYYSTFDFNSYAISLDTGKPIRKPDYSALYIVNPLQPELNVSKNVSFEEVEHLKLEMRNAVWTMDKYSEDSENLDRSVGWGIVKLFVRPNINLNNRLFPYKSRSRLVDVQSLFDEKSNNEFDNGSVLKKMT